jgi:hypothetical protein
MRSVTILGIQIDLQQHQMRTDDKVRSRKTKGGPVFGQRRGGILAAEAAGTKKWPRFREKSDACWFLDN